MLSVLLILTVLFAQLFTKGLWVITNIFSKYSFILVKNSPTISKLSFEIFPNTSSHTIMFGLGKEHTYDQTALRASAAIVLS